MRSRPLRARPGLCDRVSGGEGRREHTFSRLPDPCPSLGLPRQKGTQKMPKEVTTAAIAAMLCLATSQHALICLLSAQAWEQKEEGPWASGCISPFTSMTPQINQLQKSHNLIPRAGTAGFLSQ